VSLEHCARILKKNELRECDRLEYSIKEWTHDQVMNKDDKESYELDREMYYGVLDCLRKKNKNKKGWGQVQGGHIPVHEKNNKRRRSTNRVPPDMANNYMETKRKCP